LVLQGGKRDAAAEALLWEAHFHPLPQVALGQRLVTAGVRTAIDTSDGLLDDLAKVCQASGVAARLERDRIPVHPALRQTFPQDYWDLVLGGGEDYQLLFTAPAGVMQRVAAQEGEGVTVIGEITAGESGRVTVVDGSGRDVTPPRGGWDHFRP
jgi:thiamine-monophosphate kinase